MSTAAVLPVHTIAATDLEPLLKIEQAAQILGRSHWTLRDDVRLGKIRCIRIGRRLMFEQSEIRRLIAEGRRR